MPEKNTYFQQKITSLCPLSGLSYYIWCHKQQLLKEKKKEKKKNIINIIKELFFITLESGIEVPLFFGNVHQDIFASRENWAIFVYMTRGAELG